MKDVKEKSVQWTGWGSNRECLKIDKVVKHSSSAEIITATADTTDIIISC